MTINEMRAKTGMSQSQFAAAFGIPVNTLQHWEQGLRKPPVYLLQMVERILMFESGDVLKFRDRTHEKDYRRFLERMRSRDCYHQAVAYLLALDEVLVDHAEDVFDFDGNSVHIETALQHGWQTGTSRKTTRLLLNLWNGWCSDFIEDSGEDCASPGYAVNEIFTCSYAPYYWEAIRLRFPEYCR